MSTHDHLLPGRGLWGAGLYVFPALPSTNLWMLDHASDCRHGDAVWARQQTAGRGRFERTWESPEERGLALSVLLNGGEPADPLAGTVTRTAALAARATLAHFGIEARLKWPNDVLVHGSKIAGILAERDPATNAIVLGIGVNVNLGRADLVNAALRQPATSMALERGRTFEVEGVCSRLLADLEHEVDCTAREGPARLGTAWAQADALEGAALTVEDAGGTYSGRYAGIAADGRLGLLGADGQERWFWSGDVSLSQHAAAPPAEPDTA